MKLKLKLNGIIGASLLLISPELLAANGLYLTAYGAEQSGFGGADIANVADTGALIANPAGLANIAQRRLDISGSTFSIASISHRDEINEKLLVSNEFGALAAAGYAQRLDEQNTVLGVGVNVAGGLGFVYDDINTGFGTVDDVGALFSLVRFSGGAAWNISNDLRLGVVIAATYASADQTFFEDTSVASQDVTFFGVKMRGLYGWGGDAKIGLQYDISDTVTIGVNYTSQAKIDLEHGRMVVNYEAVGAGRVRYDDVSMKGLELPQDFGVGLQWTARPELKVAVETNWYDWSGSTNGLDIAASKPNGPAPADSISQTTALALNSQIVYSIGIEKKLTSGSFLRAGYSYHGQIMDKSTLSPTFSLIPQHDYNLGYGTKINSNWLMNIAFAYQPEKEVRYNNPDLPFGNAAETNESFSLHVTFSML